MSYLQKKHFTTSILITVISVSLVIFLLGLVGILIVNTKTFSNYAKENIGFSILLKDSLKEADVQRFQKEISLLRYVKSSNFISKEEAAAELKQELGEDFVSFLGYNPLLSSIDIRLQPEFANLDSIAVIEKEFSQHSFVKETFYRKSLVQAVNENVRKISVIMLIFSALLFSISWVLIHNTIRLAIYSKRFLLRTMFLVGATHNFIRKPFLINALWQGIFSVGISIFLLTTLLFVLQNEWHAAMNFSDIGIVFGIMFLIGVGITLLSTYFAVNKYLMLDQDNLYK